MPKLKQLSPEFQWEKNGPRYHVKCNHVYMGFIRPITNEDALETYEEAPTPHSKKWILSQDGRFRSYHGGTLKDLKILAEDLLREKTEVLVTIAPPKAKKTTLRFNWHVHHGQHWLSLDRELLGYIRAVTPREHTALRPDTPLNKCWFIQFEGYTHGGYELGCTLKEMKAKAESQVQGSLSLASKPPVPEAPVIPPAPEITWHLPRKDREEASAWVGSVELYRFLIGDGMGARLEVVNGPPLTYGDIHCGDPAVARNTVQHVWNRHWKALHTPRKP